MNKSSKSLAQTLNQEHVAGLVCTSPFIIGLFAFLLIPMGMSLYYSLCNYLFQPGYADDQWLFGIYTVLHYHSRQAHEFYFVLHGLYVSAVV